MFRHACDSIGVYCSPKSNVTEYTAKLVVGPVLAGTQGLGGTRRHVHACSVCRGVGGGSRELSSGTLLDMLVCPPMCGLVGLCMNPGAGAG